ncbi:hypothetical protein F0562_002337 [Nyssa sinensis]|uniref:Protein kinase domain-containing protein n=1 Tax=Nyssa sinensis TaxID=561372 RepID=A0A5J5C5L3_9ASTE|nr:hypothetical protein F0562_002337 [Nyssa sinensis]
MQVRVPRNIAEAMTSETPGPPGSTSVVSKDGASVGKNVNNNISIQTGEEFSVEFLQDRVIPRKVAVVPDVAQNHEKRVALNDNLKCQIGYEELTRIPALKRMDSDATEFASGKRSTAEFENGAFMNKACGYLKESGACGHGPSKATNEVNYDQAGLGPSTSSLNVSKSSQPYQPFGLGVSDGSQSGKMKFLCSFGGKILPRPGDGKLRYVGGDTRIISIRRNLSWEELVKKTLGIFNQPHTIKYQLPGEDLDALISVSSDEDLQNMVEEYHGLERLEGSQRLRIFLIPLTDENTYPLDASTIQQANPDYQYVVAVNGIVDPIPWRNYNGQYSGNEVNQLTNLECPSLHRNSSFSLHPLETKDGIGVSHPSQFINESQIFLGQSPPFSPVPVQQVDIKSHHTQLDKDKSLHGSTEFESSSLFNTTQLPPEIFSANAAGYHNLPQGLSLLNCGHPNKKVDISQPSKPSRVHFHNQSPDREFVAPSRLDKNDSNFSEYSFERPMPKERAFNSENLISHPEDPVGLLLGLNDSIDSHHGISHAFSDSQLQELGGRPGDCSQEGMSTSSPLNLTTPQLSSLIVSAALQEKSVHLQENIDFINPQLQIKLPNIEPTLSHSGVKHQIDMEDASKYNFMTQNHNEEDPLSCDMMDGFDKDRLLHRGSNLCESRSPPTAMERIDKSVNVSCDTISTPFVNTLTQKLQVSGRMIPASSAIDLKSFADAMMQEPHNYRMEKAPVELIVKGRGTAKEQQHVLPGFMGGQQGSDILWDKNSEVAGIFPGCKQQSRDENSVSNLLYGLSNGPVSHESPVLLPVSSQKDVGLQEPMLISFKDLCPSAVCVYAGPNANLKKFSGLQEPMLISSEFFYPSTVFDDAGLNANLLKNGIPTLLQNPTKDGGLRGEVSILDEDFVNYPDQKVQRSGLGVCSIDKQKLEQNTLNKNNEKNQMDLAVIVEDMIGSIPPGMKSSSAAVPYVVDATGGSEIISPAATEADSIIPESDFEDARVDDGHKDESISDAMIAEMEADIYGLQIIKNVDLEELQELGSGTYGTVYHGKWRGTDVAIKRIKKSCFAGRSSEQERLTKDFWREAQILSNLHHPNVIAFYGVVPDGAGGTLATVTEFMVNGSLRHVLLKKDRSLDHRKKLIIAMDAAFGMEYLHSKNIVHFDLKCDNLLVSLRDLQRPICKVGDFGLSRIKRNTLVSGGVRGTLPWMAPELLNSSSNRVSEKVDVFSFGIAMWEILTGEEPYANMHCGAIIGGIVKNTLRPPIPEQCDPEWRKLMEQCWSADPEARPSFTEITNRLCSMSAALKAKGHNNPARQMKPNITM